MPGPMVHLAAAVEICRQLDLSLDGSFLLGCLAPDAIHMRPGTNRMDKNRTHLLGTCLDDLNPTVSDKSRDKSRFMLGYIVHIRTDRAWVSSPLYDHFLKTLPPGTAKEVRASIYYRETDQIEFDLFRKVEWRPKVWRLLERAPAWGFPGLLTADEVSRWRDRTLGWYEPDRESCIRPKTFTYHAVLQFVETAADNIVNKMGAQITKQWR